MFRNKNTNTYYVTNEEINDEVDDITAAHVKGTSAKEFGSKLSRLIKKEMDLKIQSTHKNQSRTDYEI